MTGILANKEIYHKKICNMDFKRTRHLTEIPYEFSNPTHCMTSILEKKKQDAWKIPVIPSVNGIVVFVVYFLASHEEEQVKN